MLCALLSLRPPISPAPFKPALHFACSFAQPLVRAWHTVAHRCETRPRRATDADAYWQGHLIVLGQAIATVNYDYKIRFPFLFSLI